MHRTVAELLALACTLPCWRLRITPTEAAALRQAFDGDRNHRTRAQLAVLIASTVIREGYAGGAWSWDPIAQAIGWSDGNVALSQLVGDGLDYLNKPMPLGAGRRRLVLSGARIQAGLPTQMLAEPNGLLYQWSATVLERLQVYGVTGAGGDDTATAVRIALDNAPHGPAWTRDAGVAALVGELTLALWRLTRVADAPDGDAAELLTWLAQHRPDWRETLPVDLADEQAAAAITALLGTAQAVARPVSRPFLRMTLTSRTVPDDFDILRSLVLPAFLPEKMLSDLFGRPPGPMPSTMSVFLCTARTDHCTARLYRAAGGSKVHRETDGIRGNEPLRVEIRGWGARCIATGLANTEPLPVDRPWVFDELGDAWRLVALGSVRRRAGSLRIVLPPGAQATGDTTLIGTVMGRPLVQVSGELSIVVGDARHVVVAGSPQQDEGGSLVALGDRHRQSPEDRNVFLGVPKVAWESETGAISRVPDVEVTHRFDRPNQHWVAGLPPRGSAGTATLRWTRGGVVRGEKRLTWLPEGSGVETSVRTPTGGTLHPTGAITLVGAVNPVGFQLAQAGGNAVLTLQGAAAPIWVIIWAALAGGERVELRVPFPIRRRVFFDRSAKPVNGDVSLFSLRGMRVHVQEAGARGAEIGLRLYANGIATNHRDQVTLVDEQDGTYSLDLAAIEGHVNRLLALDLALDAYVEVGVTALPVLAAGGPVLGVRPYTRSIRRAEGRTDVVVIDPALELGLDGEQPPVRLEANRLDGVGTELLTRVHPGQRWVVPESPMGAGAWLITATVRGLEVARPLLWPLGPTPEPSGLAAACGEHDFGRRQERIRDAVQVVEDALLAGAGQRLQEVACDLDLIRQHIGLLDRTAARGLDLVRALSKCPTIAAYFLLEAAHDPFKARLLWDQLQTLPFLWALVPRGGWHQALALYRGSLEGLPESARREFEARALESVKGLHPAFAPILDDWLGTWNALAPNLQAYVRADLSVRIHAERAGTAVADGEAHTSGLLQRHLPPPNDRRDERAPQAPDDHEDWPGVPVDPSAQLPQLPREHHARQVSTLTAPWVVAARVWNNEGNSLSAEQIGNIRKIREFDRDWFDKALALALSQHLCNLPPVIS